MNLIKIILELGLLFTILNYTTISSQSKIILMKEDSRKLPENTVDIIDFNNVIINQNDQIQIINISDTFNYKVIFTFDLPEGKNYHSIQHGRYIILEDRTAQYYFQSVFDVQVNQLISLQEPNGSVGAAQIAQNDKVVLYNVNYGGTVFDKQYGKIREINRKVKLKSFNGETKVVADSVLGGLWNPNEQWFFISKFLRRESRVALWERLLMNRDGLKVSLPALESQVSNAVWSADGNYLAIRQHNGTLAVIEINWDDSLPQVKSIISKSLYSGPVLFSPDGEYIIYVKYYDDGHTTFGNDIMLTDVNLSFTKPIIKHNEIIEIPVIWNDEGLITQDGLTVKSSKNISKYEIKYK